MELHTIDVKKALAVEALVRGQYQEAENLYREVDGEYQRHDMAEGRLAILFNRLLIALEEGSRHRTAEYMGELAAALASDKDSPTALDVAERLCRLFSEPVAGVDHELTTALVALAGDLVMHINTEPDRAIDVASIPEPADLAATAPLEAAIRVLGLAEGLRGHPSAPIWLSKVGLAVGGTFAPGDVFEAAMEHYRNALKDEDKLRAYRYLVQAQATACEENPAIAFQLMVGLETLESGGLPKKLLYAPNPPQGLRFRLAAQLYQRLAEALGGEARCIDLATLFSNASIEAAEKVIGMIEARQARGGRRAVDSDEVALSRVILARAMKQVGRVGDALKVVSQSLQLAERGGLAMVLISVLVLNEVGDLNERLGYVAAAYRGYADAFRAAVPRFATAPTAVEQGTAVHEITADVERVLAAVQALSGMARNSAQTETLKFIEWARLLVDVAGPSLRGDALAKAQLLIELTAASRGAAGSGVRALEAARVLDDCAAASLSLLYWADSILASGPNADIDEQVVTLLADSAREARRLAQGGLRHGIELAIALRLSACGQGAGSARYEVLLRRVREGMASRERYFGAHPAECYLNEDVQTCVELNVRQLLSDGRVGLAYEVCQGWNECCWHDQRKEWSCGRSELEPEIVAKFDSVWIQGTRSRFQLAPYVRKERQENRNLPTTTFRDSCATFTFFREWGVVFYRDSDALQWADFDLGLRAVEQLILNGGVDPEGANPLNVRTDIVQPIIDAIDTVGDVFIATQPRLVGLGALTKGGNGLRDVPVPIVAVPAAGQDLPNQGDSRSSQGHLAIVGDDATARDLRLSTLADGKFFEDVFTVHGDGLAPTHLKDAISDARFVTLVGEITPTCDLMLRENADATGSRDLADCLLGAEVEFAIVMGPISSDMGTVPRLVQDILPGLSLGTLVRIGTADEERKFLLKFLSQAALADGPEDLIGGYNAAICEALEEAVPWDDIRCYQLFVNPVAHRGSSRRTP